VFPGRDEVLSRAVAVTIKPFPAVLLPFLDAGHVLDVRGNGLPGMCGPAHMSQERTLIKLLQKRSANPSAAVEFLALEPLQELARVLTRFWRGRTAQGKIDQAISDSDNAESLAVDASALCIVHSFIGHPIALPVAFPRFPVRSAIARSMTASIAGSVVNTIANPVMNPILSRVLVG